MDSNQKLDALRTKIDLYAVPPLFSPEIRSRSNRYAETVAREKNNLLRVMASLIAYSNNAPSDAVAAILDNGVFERVFFHFDLQAVARMNPDWIIENNWSAIRDIRFKKKVGAIIGCAKLLASYRGANITIETFFDSYNLPKDLTVEDDLDKFWRQYDTLLAGFIARDMPYFKNDTALLHLLLYVGFPCIAPDVMAMKVAAAVGLIDLRRDYTLCSLNERKFVVRTVQEYCCSRDIQPAVMDLYLLIFGGQNHAQRYVRDGYVPLTV